MAFLDFLNTSKTSERKEGQSDVSKYAQTQVPDGKGGTTKRVDATTETDTKGILDKRKSETTIYFEFKSLTLGGYTVSIPIPKIKKVEEPIPTPNKAEYGKIQVLETSAGIVDIKDSTPGNETITLMHPTQTYRTMDKDGNYTTKSIKNTVVIVDGDWQITVGKNEVKIVQGESVVNVKKSHSLNLEADYNVSVKGVKSEKVTGNTNINCDANYSENITGNKGVMVSGNMEQTIVGNDRNTIMGTKNDIVMGGMNVMCTGPVNIVSSSMVKISSPLIMLG